jgi:hypothetical protein
VLLWSVAEGRHGRRWRASTRDAGGALIDDLLLEVTTDGRIGRLELTTAAGQLTFHPEPDERTAHGNVVGPVGVRHLAIGWSPGRQLDIPGSPIADAVLVEGIAGQGVVAVATVGADLLPRLGTVTVKRVGEGSWLVDGRCVVVDVDGLPVLGRDAVSWPLEDPTVRPD